MINSGVSYMDFLFFASGFILLGCNSWIEFHCINPPKWLSFLTQCLAKKQGEGREEKEREMYGFHWWVPSSNPFLVRQEGKWIFPFLHPNSPQPNNGFNFLSFPPSLKQIRFKKVLLELRIYFPSLFLF